MTLFLMLAAFGLAFGFQNKLPFLYSKEYRTTQRPKTFFDRLLHCTYCIGFHCGWLTWLVGWSLKGDAWLFGLGFAPAIEGGMGYVQAAAGLAAWCFAVSAWCYLVDAAARKLER